MEGSLVQRSLQYFTLGGSKGPAPEALEEGSHEQQVAQIIHVRWVGLATGALVKGSQNSMLLPYVMLGGRNGPANGALVEGSQVQ